MHMNSQKKYSQKMIDICLYILLTLRSLLLLLVQLLSYQSILRRNSKITHRKMQKLTNHILTRNCNLIHRVLLILYRHHIDNLTNRVVTDMLLKIVTDLFYDLCLVPSLHIPTSQQQIINQLALNYLLFKHSHRSQNRSELTRLLTITANLQFRILQVRKQRF